jgi:prepilin-type N-terminal cleavage/methylation domain-containing protein
VPKNEGFSLIEMLVALCISSIALAAFFGAIGQFQTVNRDLGLLTERDSNLGLASLLLTKWITAAGNNRWNQEWEGFSTDGAALDARSDTEGPDGFPDEKLTESYETISVRRKGTDLQIKSKTGSFQPALKNLSQFQVEPDDLPLVRLRLAGATDRPTMTSRSAPESRMELDLYLWNYRTNLFSEAP